MGNDNGFFIFIGAIFLGLGLMAAPFILVSCIIGLIKLGFNLWDHYKMDHYYTLLVYRYVGQPSEDLNVRIFRYKEIEQFQTSNLFVIAQYCNTLAKVKEFMLKYGYSETVISK